MEKGELIGLVIGVSNLVPGVLLAVFHRPIGAACARLGKSMCKNPLFRLCLVEKLYEGNRSQVFVLVVGIWLAVWGAIAFFLLPALLGGNP